MNIEQILKLIDAGYTKDEISALTAPQTPAEDVKQTGGTDAPPIEEKPAEQTDAPQTKDEVRTLLAKIAELTDTVNSVKASQQKNNIRTQIVDTVAEQTTEDILTSIINPNFKK